ncbi:MAG TPA: putative HNHc nuclease [Sphingomicrobium sp.]|nr:putative HNHc nuclease [Sphingomicrobium sp.]
MAELRLPSRIQKESHARTSRSCPPHRAWVRKHHCSVPGCRRLPIECAHVRVRTNGGTALKPSDRWCVSLCRYHHAEQHRLGLKSFETRYGIELRALAEEFARKSPHWRRLLF